MTLVTGAKVTNINLNASGTAVTGVDVELSEGVGARQISYTGDIVAICCGAINSAALLLRCQSDQFPNGLANSSGMVGRHFMFHNSDAMVALSTHENDDNRQRDPRSRSPGAASGISTSQQRFRGHSTGDVDYEEAILLLIFLLATFGLETGASSAFTLAFATSEKITSVQASLMGRSRKKCSQRQATRLGSNAIRRFATFANTIRPSAAYFSGSTSTLRMLTLLPGSCCWKAK